MREEFMIQRDGKQYVLFAGLLDEAHSRGLCSIDSDLVQVPEESNGNIAIAKATVQMEGANGYRTFSGIGDASPANVGRTVAPHLLRMAETRAKARALRDAVNVGATALEELSDGAPGETPARQPNTQSSRAGDPPVPRGLRRKDAASRSRHVSPAPASAPEEPPADAEDRNPPCKAHQSQVDRLGQLTLELRGSDGAVRLEKHLGKPLAELTREEAALWIERLSPEGRTGVSA